MKDSNFFQAEIPALMQSKRGLSTKMETILKSNYVFSNAVLNFSDIFKCPTCKGMIK